MINQCGVTLVFTALINTYLLALLLREEPPPDDDLEEEPPLE